MPDGRPVSNYLLDLAPPDIEWFQERSDLILIPIGSCEQHGAHLPLGTDTITALEVSRRAAEKADVPYAPPFWVGYSPQHLREPETGVGTITLRASTLNAALYDVARSLIHHGWNKLVFVNGHGSNTKVLDPLLRRIKYETGAFVALYKPYAERYIGLLDDLLENPPEETPGWHASELETSQVMAHNPALVHMDRAAEDRAQVPPWLPDAFIKKDGAPDVEFDGYQYFVFPMDHAEFSRTGVIGNPMRATPEKGEQALERFGDHLVKAIDQFRPLPVTDHQAGVRGPRLSRAARHSPSPDPGADPARRRRLGRRARAGARGVAGHGPPRPRAARARGARRAGPRRRAHAHRDGRAAAVATAWTQRVSQAGGAKTAIAVHAARLVANGSTIFLDASSSALALARRLAEQPPNELTLVTNSPAIVHEIASEPIHVIACPGELDQHMRMLAGRWTVEFLEQLNFDVAFISSAGVTLDAGLTTSRRPLADVLIAATAHAERTLGLIDATKFGRAGAAHDHARPAARPDLHRQRAGRRRRAGLRSRRRAAGDRQRIGGADGTTGHVVHRPVGRPVARGPRRQVRRLGLRRAGAGLLGRPLRRRRGAERQRLLRAGGARCSSATGSAAGRSATTSWARRSATRSTSATAGCWRRRSGATATPRACAPAPPRR